MFTFHSSHVAHAAKRIANRARDACSALLGYWIMHLPVCSDPIQFFAAVIAAALMHLYRMFRRWLAAAKPTPIKVAACSKETTARIEEVLRT